MGMKMSCNRAEEDDDTVKTLERVFLCDAPPSEWNVKIYNPISDNEPSSSMVCSGKPTDAAPDSDEHKRRRILRDSWMTQYNKTKDNIIELNNGDEKEMKQVIEDCVKVCINTPENDDNNSLSSRTSDDEDGLPSSCIMPRTSVKRPRDF